MTPALCGAIFRQGRIELWCFSKIIGSPVAVIGQSTSSRMRITHRRTCVPFGNGAAPLHHRLAAADCFGNCAAAVCRILVNMTRWARNTRRLRCLSFPKERRSE